MLVRTWRTNDGRMIPLNLMSVDHINSCIARIERLGGRWRAEWLEAFQLELLIRSLK